MFIAPLLQVNIAVNKCVFGQDHIRTCETLHCCRRQCSPNEIGLGLDQILVHLFCIREVNAAVRQMGVGSGPDTL